MRANDLFGWYCVLHAATRVLEHATKIHLRQTSCALTQSLVSRKRRLLDNGGGRRSGDSDNAVRPPNHRVDYEGAIHETQELTSSSDPQRSGDTSGALLENSAQNIERHAIRVSLSTTLGRMPKSIRLEEQHAEADILVSTVAPADIASSIETKTLVDNKISVAPTLRASKVPSSRMGRIFHYGGLAASLGYGAASELLRRSSPTNGSDLSQPTSLLMTEANLNRLVSKLSQMRGAALKLGQFMSIQDSHVLPEELERVFRRVQDSAHYMPNWQMENVMTSSLGPAWRTHFDSFTPIPSHAASIGQVHTGTLSPASSPTGKKEEVAIKIQFPKIAESISSDLGYMKLLLGASALLPKGLFLDSTIKVFKAELKDECDYKREASYIRKYRAIESLKSDSRYRVPWVWDGSTEHVLIMERMKGISVGGEIVNTLSQVDRDEIASRIIELCLRELFEFRMMQTDPNWTNFLWNTETRQVELIDFGATREYSKEFIGNWLGLLSAAVDSDSDACIEWSRKLGYLVGGENEAMINAHLTSMRLLGTPFREATRQPFSFARGSAWTNITQEIRSQIPIMLNNRLTPPPRETYSLNRKLSGAFLLAGRLGARVDCRSVWERVAGGILSSM